LPMLFDVLEVWSLNSRRLRSREASAILARLIWREQA
jgi:hypothetical protein